MSVTLHVGELKYKDSHGVYHGVNAVAEKKLSDFEDDVEEIIDNMADDVTAQQTRANGIVADATTAVNNLDAQKDTIAQTVASMAQLGTDTTLSTSGMAADAKKTGDEIGDLKSALMQSLDSTGENKLTLDKITGVSNATYEVDNVNNTITITSTAAKSYVCAQTNDTYFINNLETGKRYRFHAIAEGLSGYPDIRIAIKGTSESETAIALSAEMGEGGETFFDFTADDYMKRASLIITGSLQRNASAIFSDVWLKEIDNSGIDKTARSEIKDFAMNQNIFRMLWTKLPKYKNFSTDHFTDTNKSRLGTAEIIQAPFDIRLYTPSGYNVYVLYFTSTDPATYTGNSGWTSNIIIPANTYFSILFRKSDNAKTLVYDDFWRTSAAIVHSEFNDKAIDGLYNNNVFKALWSKSPTNKYFNASTHSFEISTSNIRACIPEIIQAPFTLPLKIDSTYKFTVAYFTSDDPEDYTGLSGWKDEIVIEKGQYFTFTVKKTDGTAFDSSVILSMISERYLSVDYLDDLQSSQNVISFNLEEQNAIIASRRRKNVGKDSYATRTPILTLLHFSDIHQDATALRNITKYREKLEPYIDDVICTGDMVTTWGAGMDWWHKTDGADDILLCMGNHEIQVDASTAEDYGDHYTIAQAYGQYFEDVIANWDVEYTADLTYYYKDYTDQHIRLIVLDCMIKADQDAIAAQNTWLETTLAGARTAGYTVVIAAHFANRANKVAIESNFTMLDHAPSGTALLTTYCDTVQDFIDAGGDFACWLSGHEHLDYIHTCEAYPSQIVLCIGEAKNEERWGDLEREANSKSADLFNVVSFDTYTKNLKIIRVGANRDTYLRHRGTLVLNWQSKQVKHSD